MYAWLSVFMTEHLASRGAVLPAAAFLTFFIIAAGSPGSWIGGILSDRLGRTTTTIGMMAVSGLCSLTIGLLHGGATWLLVLVGLIWGFTIVADSAQFSAMVTETAEQSYVGTALTMQVAIGFTVTVVTIWLIPIVEQAVGWRWSFTILALGPLVGIAAMLRLKRSPEAAQLAGGLG